IAGKRMQNFGDIRSEVVTRPNAVVSVEFERRGQFQQLDVRIGTDLVPDGTGKKVKIGLLGVGPAPVPLTQAAPLAVVQTVQITRSLVEGIGKLIIGQGS